MNDVQGAIREILLNAVENAGKGADSASAAVAGKSHSGKKALAATLGAAVVTPIALKGAARLADELGIDTLEVIKSPETALANLTANVGDRVGAGIGQKVSQKVEESGGPSGILKDSILGALPFGSGGGGGGTKGGALGVGKGRRIPVQQSVDIGIPLETVYNQWTQFELWPDFMHRVTRVTQDDECTVSFAVKVWGKTKEFNASIETQRPDERIKWKVTEGIVHAGVVTFHELGPRLTRVLLDLDVEPGSLVEKAARGLRHVKRAARSDLHRFKAFIEMQEAETGAWRGRIEDGELVEEHDPKYDGSREYSNPNATLGDRDVEEEAEDDRGRTKGRDDSEGRGRTADARSTSRTRRSSTRNASSGSRRASSEAGQGRRSTSRASGRSSATKTRGRQATVRKNS